MLSALYEMYIFRGTDFAFQKDYFYNAGYNFEDDL